jgi:hypothetical protein
MRAEVRGGIYRRERAMKGGHNLSWSARADDSMMRKQCREGDRRYTEALRAAG